MYSNDCSSSSMLKFSKQFKVILHACKTLSTFDCINFSTKITIYQRNPCALWKTFSNSKLYRRLNTFDWCIACEIESIFLLFFLSLNWESNRMWAVNTMEIYSEWTQLLSDCFAILWHAQTMNYFEIELF